MTLGVGVPDRDYLEPQHALEGRALSNALSVGYGGDSSFEISRSVDPSDGANQAGGSNYTEGLSLGASNAGLAGAAVQNVRAKQIRDVRAGNLTYEEAMNWTPSPTTAALSALEKGPFMEETKDVRPGFGGVTVKQVGWLALLGGAAWWLYNR